MNSEQRRQHLYHVLFNDAVAMMIHNDCNHNAADRSMCYDRWLADVRSEDFAARAAEAADRYAGHQKDGIKEVQEYVEEVMAWIFPWAEKKLARPE